MFWLSQLRLLVSTQVKELNLCDLLILMILLPLSCTNSIVGREKVLTADTSLFVFHVSIVNKINNKVACFLLSLSARTR